MCIEDKQNMTQHIIYPLSGMQKYYWPILISYMHLHCGCIKCYEPGKYISRANKRGKRIEGTDIRTR